MENLNAFKTLQINGSRPRNLSICAFGDICSATVSSDSHQVLEIQLEKLYYNKRFRIKSVSKMSTKLSRVTYFCTYRRDASICLTSSKNSFIELVCPRLHMIIMFVYIASRILTFFLLSAYGL